MDKYLVIKKLLDVIQLYQHYYFDDSELLSLITEITNRIEIKILNKLVEDLIQCHKDNI